MPNNNDPNQSGRGPANTAASVGAEHLPIGITNAINKSATDTLTEKYLREDNLNIKDSPAYIAGQKYPGQFTGTSFGDQIDKLNTQHDKNLKKLNMIEESSGERTRSAIATSINNNFSNATTNGQAESRLSSPEIQRAIRQQAGSMSSQQVYHNMEANKKQLAGYETELHDINRNKLVDRYGQVDPEQKKRMNEIFGMREEALNEKSTLHGIGKFHKEQGKDSMSQTMDMLKTQTQAQSIMAAGGTGSSEAKEFLDILKKLNEVLDDTSQEFKDLSGSLDNAKIKLDNASHEGNQTTWGVKGDTWKKAALIGQMGETIGNTIITMGVDHRIKDRQNIAGMAGLANERYENYVAARHGDVAAQLASKSWGASERFGEQVKGAQMTGETAQTTGKAVQNIAKTALAVGAKKAASAALAAAAIETAPLALTGAGAIIPVSLAAASAYSAWSAYSTGAAAVANTAIDVDSQARGLKTAPAYINAVRSNNEANKAINAIPAKQMQGLRDFYVGAGSVAMGMGSRAEGFLNQMTDTGDDAELSAMKARHGDTRRTGTLEKMAVAGISPEQMAQMANLSNQTVGGQFNLDQALELRKYEKASFGSKEINLQRQGQLADAGSNNPQAGFESVVASAMTKGLDGSKALGMMVTNTAALVESGIGAKFGFDTTALTAASLASYASKDPNENKQFILKQAKSAEDIARSADTNVSTTYSGQLNTARLHNRLGLGDTEQLLVGKSESAVWKGLSTDPNAVDKLQEMGMGRINKVGPNKGKERTLKEAQEFALTVLDIKQDQRIEGEGTMNAIHGGVSPTLRKKLKSGIEPTKADGALYDEFAQNAGMLGMTPHVYFEYQKSGKENPTDKTAFNNKINPKGGTPLTAQEKTDALRTSGDKQLSESAATAALALDAFGGAIEQFLRMTKAAEADGMGKEAEAGTAAGQAATDFKLGVEKFGPVIDKLDDVLNDIIAKTGMYVSRAPPDQKTQTGSQARGNEMIL